MRRSILAVATATLAAITLSGCAASTFTAAAGDLDVEVSLLERGDSLIEPGTEMCMLGVQMTNTSDEEQGPNSLGIPIFYSAAGENLDRQPGHFFEPDAPIEHESGAIFYPDISFPLAPGDSATYIQVVPCAPLGEGATVEFESESFPVSF